MLWAHKTGAELEIHRNFQSASVILSSGRHGVKSGKVEAVRIPGELTGRRENNTRASAQHESIPTSILKRIKPEIVPPRIDLVRQRLERSALPSIVFRPCPGGRTATQFNTSVLRLLEEEVVTSGKFDSLEVLVKRIRTLLKWEEDRVLLALAWRREHGFLPARPREVKLLEKGNLFFDTERALLRL